MDGSERAVAAGRPIARAHRTRGRCCCRRVCCRRRRSGPRSWSSPARTAARRRGRRSGTTNTHARAREKRNRKRTRKTANNFRRATKNVYDVYDKCNIVTKTICTRFALFGYCLRSVRGARGGRKNAIGVGARAHCAARPAAAPRSRRRTIPEPPRRPPVLGGAEGRFGVVAYIIIIIRLCVCVCVSVRLCACVLIPRYRSWVVRGGVEVPPVEAVDVPMSEDAACLDDGPGG